MKIIVPVKRVIDPYVRIQVDEANNEIKTSNVKMAINPFDEIALEEALRIAEARKSTSTEVIVVSVGGKSSQETLRHGLALGAQRAIHIETEKRYQPLSIAKILMLICQQEQPDIVLMGKQAIDGDNNQTGQMLAALLAWPQATFASAVNFTSNGLEVMRELDGGTETLALPLPAIITCDLRLNEPRYASLPNIMKAKSKPMQTMTVAQLELDLTEDMTLEAIRRPNERQKGIKVADAHELVTKLKEKEQVL